MISERLRVTMLFDFYGVLLTKRQQKCIRLHFFDDLSLSEVADNLLVSRQAVYDVLKRSILTMENFEDKLHLIKLYKEQQKSFMNLKNILIDSLSDDKLSKVKEAIDILDKQINK